MPLLTAYLSRLELLRRDLLVKTSDVDEADWNYRPLLGRIQRLRFRLVMRLLRDRHFTRLLEVGYGSGVFMPTLKRFADELCGIDVHEHADDVTRSVERAGLEVDLRTASAEQIPFADGFFGAIVVVSAFEFIPDPNAACMEFRRVLEPGGSLVVVTPGQSTLLDLGLRVLTGNRAEESFADRRAAVVPTLERHFRVRRRIVSPRLLGTWIPLYTALDLEAP